MSKVTAGAYRNNCGFHCLAHTCFNLSDEKFKELFKKNPIYTDLMIKFYQYYNLGDNYDVGKFRDLINQFSHPLDREIFSGQVFREFFRQQNPNDKLKDGEEVPDDMLGKYANQLGASLNIVVDEKHPDFNLQFPAQQSLWKATLYHTPKGGGHYDFTYFHPDREIAETLNRSHNEQFISDKLDSRGQRVSKSPTLLGYKPNILGVREQTLAIKDVVKQQYENMARNKMRNR